MFKVFNNVSGDGNPVIVEQIKVFEVGTGYGAS